MKIFTHQLQILNEKILCESCEESFDPASIKSHLTAKRCKEYYEKKRENFILLKKDVDNRQKHRKRLRDAIKKLKKDTKSSVNNINYKGITVQS